MPQVISLARQAYAHKLLAPCVETLIFHEQCLRNGISEGRVLFKMEHQGRIFAVAGLHTPVWGPAGVSWASWFFVHPDYRRRLVSYKLFRELVREATERGYRRLYVETPSVSVEYSSAAQYLARLGFIHEATLRNYYDAAVHLEIHCLSLRHEPLHAEQSP